MSFQLSYAIGVTEPISISINDYGTALVSKKKLLSIVKRNFDLRPGMVIKELGLLKPIYDKILSYGHFGRDGFPWETPKKLII